MPGFKEALRYVPSPGFCVRVTVTVSGTGSTPSDGHIDPSTTEENSVV